MYIVIISIKIIKAIKIYVLNKPYFKTCTDVFKEILGTTSSFLRELRNSRRFIPSPDSIVRLPFII